MENGRKIIGGLMILVGLVLGLLHFLLSFKESFVLLIYGVPIMIIGFVILFNKKEDTIEQIKQTGGKK
jgi:thiamine transporter ThiT